MIDPGYYLYMRATNNNQNGANKMGNKKFEIQTTIAGNIVLVAAISATQKEILDAQAEIMTEKNCRQGAWKWVKNDSGICPQYRLTYIGG